MANTLKLKFAKTFVELSDIVNFDNRCYPIHISLDRILEEDPNNSILIEELYDNMEGKMQSMQNELDQMKSLRTKLTEISDFLKLS
tara:strand:- start:248 stop:505 length:258 start_codon:yes stop_codon:yes gene_type:complete